MKKINLTPSIFAMCESRSTRNGFCHNCTLFYNDREVSFARVSYLNRTWESYQFQTVIFRAIEKCLKDRKLKAYPGRQPFDDAMTAATNYKETGGALHFAALVAKMGDIFGGNASESNEFKKRMLATTPGIQFPEDWDSLSEEEKSRRLDGAINNVLEK